MVAAWHAGNTNLGTQVERHDVIAVSQPQIKLLEHTASLAHKHTRRLVEGQDLVHEASGQYKLVVHRYTATDEPSVTPAWYGNGLCEIRPEAHTYCRRIAGSPLRHDSQFVLVAVCQHLRHLLW